MPLRISGIGGAGVPGTGIQSITFKETDPDGNFIYTFHMTDGTTTDIKFPKGQAISLDTASTNELLVKKDNGELIGSGVFLTRNGLETDHHISAKSIDVSPNTVKIGSIKLEENGSFLTSVPDTGEGSFLFLDYKNDPDNGTSLPIYYERRPKNEGSVASQGYIIIQNDDSQQVDGANIHYGNPTVDSQIQSMYVKFVDNVTNLRLCIEVNGNEIAYYPSKDAWDGKVKGGDFHAGRRELELKPFFTFFKKYDVTFKFKADQTVTLLGNGTKPWLSVDRNEIRKHNLALADHLTPGAPETPEEIRDELKKLTPGNKLPYTALDGTPAPYDDSILSARIGVAESDIQTNEQSITDLTNEVNRIKTDTTDGTKTVFTGRIRDDIENQIPNDAPYHGYFVSAYALDNSPQNLNLPKPLIPIDNGTMFILDNQASAKSIMVRPRHGDEIDGSQGVNVPPQNMLALVKNNLGWSIAFSGFIPDSLTSLVNVLKTKLPSVTPLTIDQIQQQLKTL